MLSMALAMARANIGKVIIGALAVIFGGYELAGKLLAPSTPGQAVAKEVGQSVTVEFRCLSSWGGKSGRTGWAGCMMNDYEYKKGFGPCGIVDGRRPGK